MHSDHSDIWTGIGALGSSAIAVYGWLYDIGLAQLFMFIAGACFSMFAQERLEKKRRKRDFELKMTEHVYGPMHKELSSILIELRAFGRSTPATVENIMNDFKFSLIKDELHHRIKNFQEKLWPHTALLNEAERKTHSYIEGVLRGHKIMHGVTFSIWAGGSQIFNFPMLHPIFEDKTPLHFMIERAKPFRNASVTVNINNKSEGFSGEHRIHKISIDILTKVREDSTVQQYRREREDLLKECNSLIELIRKKIVL